MVSTRSSWHLECSAMKRLAAMAGTADDEDPMVYLQKKREQMAALGEMAAVAQVSVEIWMFNSSVSSHPQDLELLPPRLAGPFPNLLSSKSMRAASPHFSPSLLS